MRNLITWNWKSLLIRLLLLYSNLQRRAIQFFSKKFLHKCLFKIPLWRKVITSLLIFLISSINLMWKQNFHTDTFWNYLVFEYCCLVGLNIKKRTRQRKGALMSNHCMISHHRYDVEKLTVPGNSNLKVQHKVLC